MPKFIGQLRTRIIAVVLIALFVSIVISFDVHVNGKLDHGRFILLFLTGALAFAVSVFSFQWTYARWMSFAQKIQAGVQLLLFSTIYFLIVPIFAIPRYLLTRKKKPETVSTYWRKRQPSRVDIDFLRRMG